MRRRSISRRRTKSIVVIVIPQPLLKGKIWTLNENDDDDDDVIVI